jgi:hypothetical protein
MDGPSQIRRESREIVFFRSKTEEICSDIGDDGIILWALFLLSGLTQLAIRRMAKKREGLNRKGIYVGILFMYEGKGRGYLARKGKLKTKGA